MSIPCVRRATVPRSGIGFGAQTLHVDRPAPAHGHDFVELAVVLRGTGTHVTRHGRGPVRRGDAIAVPAYEWHGWTDPDGLTVANVYVDQEALRGDLAVTAREPALRALAWSPGSSSTLPGGTLDEQALAEVEHAVARMGHASSTAATGHLLVALGVLATVFPAAARGPVHPAVQRVQDRLRADPARPWTTRELADLAGYHPQHLTRLFRQGLGLSPTAVLGRLRAERAAALLTGSDEPVATIGRRVGWDDPNYFARRFRELYGVSPRAYRSRFR